MSDNKYKKYKSKKEKESISQKFSQFKTTKHLVKPILFVTLLIIFQAVLLFYLYNYISTDRTSRTILDTIWTIVSLVMIIYIVNQEKAVDYKITWIIVIGFAPVFAGILYLFLEVFPGPKQLKRKLTSIKESTSYLLVQDESVHNEIVENNEIDHGLETYLYKQANYPIYKNTSTKYFEIGETYFESLKQDLLNAKSFIFIEYFIVRKGQVLEEVLSILEEKVKEGVEVKLMYDGTNDYSIPDGFKEFIESLGIEVNVFAPVLPILSTYHNNRDHRKIVVIDNEIGYTGGLNLSDEYVNLIDRFGHWKDNGIRIEGEAVRSMTLMFLNLWDLSKKDKSDYEKYIQNKHSIRRNNYVQPYDDSPNDGENVGENVYIDILNQAKDYVYIMTPYLILSENIKNAIIFAAKRGVDVEIMMPGIADKKIPYIMGRSYYEELLRHGVKIYEYVPGFLHSKSFVSDDCISVVGSVNLDFRSLHLHYENGILCYDKEFTNDVKKDFIETRKLCREMTLIKMKEFSWLYRVFGRVLRLIAPLM